MDLWGSSFKLLALILESSTNKCAFMRVCVCVCVRECMRECVRAYV